MSVELSVEFCKKCRSLITHNHCSNRKCEDAWSTHWNVNGIIVDANNPITFDAARIRAREIEEREKKRKEEKNKAANIEREG